MVHVLTVVGNLGVHLMNFLYSQECGGYGGSLECNLGYLDGAMECRVMVMFVFV